MRGVRLGGRAEGSGRVTDLERVLHNHAAPFWFATRHRPTVRPYLLYLGLDSLSLYLLSNTSNSLQQPQLGLYWLQLAKSLPKTLCYGLIYCN